MAVWQWICTVASKVPENQTTCILEDTLGKCGLLWQNTRKKAAYSFNRRLGKKKKKKKKGIKSSPSWRNAKTWGLCKRCIAKGMVYPNHPPPRLTAMNPSKPISLVWSYHNGVTSTLWPQVGGINGITSLFPT